MGHALLPEDMEEPTVGAMTIGDVAYVVPWAMAADQNRRLWMDPSYQVHSGTGGTIRMKIRRDTDGLQVWEVPAAHYAPSQLKFDDPLPVALLIRSREAIRTGDPDWPRPHRASGPA